MSGIKAASKTVAALLLRKSRCRTPSSHISISAHRAFFSTTSAPKANIKESPIQPHVVLENDSVVVLSRPVTVYQQNQSLVGCKRTGEAALVDCGGHPRPFLEAAEIFGLNITGILQTHAHVDHVAGLGDTRAALPDAPLHLHPLDDPVYESVPQAALDFGVDLESPLPPVDIPLQDRQTLRIGEMEMEVRHTPGHSPGHCVFVCRKHQFVIGGDLLFRGSVGRTDLPLSDPRDMEESIRVLYGIDGLDSDCLILPGHTETTTLGTERRTNPFVKAWLEKKTGHATGIVPE